MSKIPKVDQVPPRISVIIVNWNSREYVRACLRCLSPELERITSEIFVVDSGSFDGCGEMLAAAYPSVRFIQAAENVGFPRANNLAAAGATGEWLLLLNPDTEVQTGSVRRLLEVGDSVPGVGVVGARLVNTDGSLQTSCVQAFPTLLGEILGIEWLRLRTPSARLWGMASLFDPSIQVGYVDMISGACMLIRRRVFEQVGAFSLDYFIYVEDVDLCRKVRMAGLKNLYVADALVLHHGGGSSRQVSGFSAKNRCESLWRYFQKWEGKSTATLYRVAIGFAALARVAGLLASECLPVPEKRRMRIKAALQKWAHVLRWSMGLA